MTQPQLAKVAEISVPYLPQLESGKRKGSTDVLLAVARGLDLTLDDLVDGCVFSFADCLQKHSFDQQSG